MMSSTMLWRDYEHICRAHLQQEAEVGGCSVFLFVVVGGVDVNLFEMDKTGEITGGLEQSKNTISKCYYIVTDSNVEHVHSLMALTMIAVIR